MKLQPSYRCDAQILRVIHSLGVIARFQFELEGAGVQRLGIIFSLGSISEGKQFWSLRTQEFG